MTWTKLGDEFPEEAEPLSDGAFRTHVEALAWSNRKLLDLLVPERHLRKFATTECPEAAVAELMASGWWEKRAGEWYIGLKFPEWQRERAEVIHRRDKLREAQARSRKHRRGDHTLCLPSACANAMTSALSSLVSTVDTSDESAPVSTDPPRDGTGRVGTESLPAPPGGGRQASPREVADASEHAAKIREDLSLKTVRAKEPPPNTGEEAARQAAALEAWAAQNGIPSP